MLKSTAIVAVLLAGTASASPNVCQTVTGEETMQDPTKSPIKADVKPDGNVTFHFKNNNPPPITINGLEPLPDPTAKVDRNLQEYLHKRARSEYRRCMHEESLKVRHPYRHPLR